MAGRELHLHQPSFLNPSDEILHSGMSRYPTVMLPASSVLLLILLVVYFCQQCSNISVNADTPIFDFSWAECLPIVQAGINGLIICHCHLPERILDNNRGICTYSKFKIQYMKRFMPSQKFRICR